MTDLLSASGHAHEDKAARNWRAVVDNMTDVQKMIHLAHRHTDDDQRVWRNTIFDQLRSEYTESIRQEVIGIGCPDPGRVYLREGAELKLLAQRAEKSATSIVNTYNYDLANAVIAVFDETPRANRYTYAARLREWGEARKAWKQPQIGENEAAWAVNRAKETFWAMNADIRAAAEVWPYPTVCDVCAAYVAKNPYPSMANLYDRCELPAHPRCPHHGRPLLDRKLTRDECRELWIGG